MVAMPNAYTAGFFILGASSPQPRTTSFPMVTSSATIAFSMFTVLTDGCIPHDNGIPDHTALSDHNIRSDYRIMYFAIDFRAFTDKTSCPERPLLKYTAAG